MLSNHRLIAVASICIFALQAELALAAGASHGHPGKPGHSHPGGIDHGRSTAGNTQNALPSYANSWPYLRAENGIFGPVWAAPGPGSAIGSGIGGGGWGGGGYGWGGGWGGEYGPFDYDIAPPYFDFFPPVYYSYDKGAAVPNLTANVANETVPSSGQPAGQAAYVPPGQSSPPLRIINPYYNSGK